MAIPYKELNNYKDRQLLERLDILIELLLNEKQLFDDLLRGLVASIVPMAPSLSQTIVVMPIPVFLVENTVISLMRVDITNDDIAVPIFVGNRDVSVPAGRIIQPGETVPFVLRKGQRLYGVVNVGAVNAIISFAESSYQAITSGPVVM